MPALGTTKRDPSQFVDVRHMQSIGHKAKFALQASSMRHPHLESWREGGLWFSLQLSKSRALSVCKQPKLSKTCSCVALDDPMLCIFPVSTGYFSNWANENDTAHFLNPKGCRLFSSDFEGGTVPGGQTFDGGRIRLPCRLFCLKTLHLTDCPVTYGAGQRIFL